MIGTNVKTFYLRATTYGGLITADQKFEIVVCPKTGGASVTLPYSNYYDSVDLNAVNPANILTFN